MKSSYSASQRRGRPSSCAAVGRRVSGTMASASLSVTISRDPRTSSEEKQRIRGAVGGRAGGGGRMADGHGLGRGCCSVLVRSAVAPLRYVSSAPRSASWDAPWTGWDKEGCRGRRRRWHPAATTSVGARRGGMEAWPAASAGLFAARDEAVRERHTHYT
ncbi:hypothetical protein CDD83_9207 [Cordyceps sp. RAO-2017]|nr:hypothetical protein CDD83_9207 [Cordyceps sp. RAO-2017]